MRKCTRLSLLPLRSRASLTVWLAVAPIEVGDDTTQGELLARVADLSAMNAQLSADVARLKHDVAQRQAETARRLTALDALQRIESDVRTLQREFRTVARSNAVLVQDALVGKLESEQQQTQHGDSEGDWSSAVQRNRQAIAQLHAELRACRAPGSGTETMANESETALGRRMDTLRTEMAMLKQFLLQESSTSRSGIEKLLVRELGDFQAAQDDEAKRLQAEMDELRSELCDVLREMHLLKERTRYLRPACAKRRRQRRPQSCSGAPAADATRGVVDVPVSQYPMYPLASFTERPSSSGSPSSSQSSSPRRPSDEAIETLAQQNAGDDSDRLVGPTSPHFSSRSSSISGRLSASRGA